MVAEIYFAMQKVRIRPDPSVAGSSELIHSWRLAGDSELPGEVIGLMTATRFSRASFVNASTGGHYSDSNQHAARLQLVRVG
jgi:hypothetical protein